MYEIEVMSDQNYLWPAKAGSYTQVWYPGSTDDWTQTCNSLRDWTILQDENEMRLPTDLYKSNIHNS